MKPTKTTITNASTAEKTGGSKVSTLNRPAKVPVENLRNIAMTTGGEKKYAIVIDCGTMKEWVGIGWIDIGKAEPADYAEYPEVDRG